MWNGKKEKKAKCDLASTVWFSPCMWGRDHGITQNRRIFPLWIFMPDQQWWMLIYLHFVSVLTSPWAEVSWEKLCKLTGLGDISRSQPSGILMSGRRGGGVGRSLCWNWRVLFALTDAAWEGVQAAGALPCPGVDVQAGKQPASKRLLFCIAACQALDGVLGG